MSYTQQDLDAVRAAIATGARTVEYRDRRVTYQSTDDLMKAEAHIAQSLAAAAGTTRSKVTMVVGEKGL